MASSDSTDLHLLPVFEIDDDCYLVRGTPNDAKRVRRLPVYARHVATIERAWVLEPEWREQALAKRVACQLCALGIPCPAWDDIDFASGASDYVPHPPGAVEPPSPFDATAWLSRAASLLGLAWPCKRGEIKKAFAALIIHAHPDRPNGSEKATKDLIAARDTLLQHARE